MVGFVTRMRETRDQRGGLCLTEDEANYYFRREEGEVPGSIPVGGVPFSGCPCGLVLHGAFAWGLFGASRGEGYGVSTNPRHARTRRALPAPPHPPRQLIWAVEFCHHNHVAHRRARAIM